MQAGAQFMKHAKRKRMTPEDFNKALRWSDTEVSQFMIVVKAL